jgi:hypothetical protein
MHVKILYVYIAVILYFLAALSACYNTGSPNVSLDLATEAVLTQPSESEPPTEAVTLLSSELSDYIFEDSSDLDMPIPETEEEAMHNDEMEPDAALLFSQYHPLVVYGFLIGGSKDEDWLEASEFAGELTGHELYDLYRVDGRFGESKGSVVEPETEDWSGPYVEAVNLGYEEEISFDLFDDPFFALNCDWDAMPRLPIKQSNNSAVYKQIIFDILAECGLSNANVEIQQNYKIDLDGDGIDEVVIYAENVAADRSEDYITPRFDKYPGCFSILVLRKIVNGEVKNFVLEINIHKERVDDKPYTYIRYLFPIIAFADLNGDNRMEIIASFRYYEGMGARVYEIVDDDIYLVMANGVYF